MEFSPLGSHTAQTGFSVCKIVKKGRRRWDSGPGDIPRNIFGPQIMVLRKGSTVRRVYSRSSVV